ncbi:DUF4403 family protein [Zunongwangia sp. F363]|uniref:DUF4403 family protein n=1 Tax=Autumnicola tepida TaxID=3075595 RepID=A0ABU3C4Z1_9FLAO|nr:DUF4403 family protein [Zunongwangia sp. F363]MDT0641402.1 DUF4403 family protein [Zunongwangia sp. F363]
MQNISPGNLILQLPLKVQYGVMEDILRDRAIGEKIGTVDDKGETTNYAEILDITFGESLREDFDFAVNLKFKTLTKLFKNKIGRLEMDVALEFDEATQEIGIKNYNLEGDTNNWLMNNFIEKMVNNVLYGTLKKKMKFDLSPLIARRLEKINSKFLAGMEPLEGILATGEIKNFKIDNIVPGSGFLLIQVSLNAEAMVAIEHLNLEQIKA